MPIHIQTNMKKITNTKPWKYLILLLGLFLTSAGISLGIVSGVWGGTTAAALIPGLILIIGWLIWQTLTNQWWQKRSTQTGTNAILATIAVTAILGLMNFLATRYTWRVDTTENKLFTLAPQTVEVLRSLQTPVKLSVFSGNQNPIDRNLLENYRRQSPKFQFEYIDPLLRPQLARKYSVSPEGGDVFIEANNNRKLVQTLTSESNISEVLLTSRLQQIISTSNPKVYFLQGHGEYSLESSPASFSTAVSVLKDRNFSVEPLNLTQSSKIPEDADVIIIAGAKRALLPQEVQAIQTFLNQGGNLLVLLDVEGDPKLDPIFQEWGVTIDNRIAIDTVGSQFYGPAVTFINEYGEHPITKNLQNNISFYRLARPIDTTPVDGVTATPLLTTKPYPQSWAESDTTSEKLEFNEGKDRKGPFNIGVALVKQIKNSNPTPTATPTPTTESTPTATSTPTPTPLEKTPPKEARMVIIGDADFASNGLFEQQINGDVFLNSVSWVSQEEQPILSIRPREAKNRRLNLSTFQSLLLRLSSLFILPLIGFIGGGLLWWQRR